MDPACAAVTFVQGLGYLLGLTSRIREYLRASKDIDDLEEHTKQLEAVLYSAQVFAKNCTPEISEVLEDITESCLRHVEKLRRIVAKSERLSKKVGGNLGVQVRSMYWSAQASKVAKLNGRLRNGMSNLLLYLVIIQR